MGHSLAKHKQKQEYDELGMTVDMCPRFIYALAKSQDGLPTGIEGTYPRVAAKVLQKSGCATESTLTNDTTLTHAEYIDLANIPATAYTEALQFSIKSYAFATLTEQGLKDAILAGGADLLMRLGEEWWKAKDGRVSWAAEDILPIRPPSTIISGHEVFLYGWDTVDGRTRFWIVNSWSKDWAMNGIGYFFYDEYRPFLDEAITAIDLPDNWLEELNNLPPANQFKHRFLVNLAYGQKSEEVRFLQIALKINGTFPSTVAETGYYGDITAKAVLDFQKKYNVASLYELLVLRGRNVGPKTRAKLNELYGQ